MTAGKIRLRNEEEKSFNNSNSEYAEKDDIITFTGGVIGVNENRDDHASCRVSCQITLLNDWLNAFICVSLQSYQQPPATIFFSFTTLFTHLIKTPKNTRMIIAFMKLDLFVDFSVSPFPYICFTSG